MRTKKGALFLKKKEEEIKGFCSLGYQFLVCTGGPSAEAGWGTHSCQSLLVMFAIGPSQPSLLSHIFSALQSKGSELRSLFWECAPFFREKSNGFCVTLSAAEWPGWQTPSEERKEGPAILASEPCCWHVYLLDCRNSKWSDHLSRRLEDVRRTEEIVDRPVHLGRITCDRKAERYSLVPGIQLGKRGKLC